MLLIHLMPFPSMSHAFHSTPTATRSSHRSHTTSMTSHSWSVHARKGLFILNESPYLFIRQDLAKPNHAGSWRSMLDDPENFSLCAVSPEPMMLKIPRGGIQLGASWSCAVSIDSMTGEARALAVIERLPFFYDRLRCRERAPERSSFRQLIGRHDWLHHMPFCPTGRNSKENHNSQ